MKRVGLFLDIDDLFHSVKTRYKKNLDYEKYYEFIKNLGEIKIANAYGFQARKEATGFLKVLKRIGYEPIYKKLGTSWHVGIAIDVIKNISDLDIIVLGVSSPCILELIKYCKDEGKTVVLLASGIRNELAELATETIEIPESLLKVLS